MIFLRSVVRLGMVGPALAANLVVPGAFGHAAAGRVRGQSAARPLDSTSVAGTIARFVGPIPSNVGTHGGVFARYESDFARFDEKQWTTCGPKWDCINYYDRALIYYVWWQRTGNEKYRDRANQVALNYRQTYLDPNNGGIAHHWAMSDGVALHYLVTGDPASLVAVGKLADAFAWLVNSGYLVTGAAADDDRLKAYAIKTMLAAYTLNAPSTGCCNGVPGRNNWAKMLRATLAHILADRDPDGQWRGACVTPAHQTVRAAHPFTVGLLYDALIRYYDVFEPDPRIPQAIQQSANVMWRDDWIPASNAFKYIEVDCTRVHGDHEGGPNPAPDLNNLIVNGFAWVYKTTGDVAWRARADQIFAGGVNAQASSNGAKWMNQEYTSSFRYLAWRFAP